MTELKDRIALVTGAAGGIGFEIAKTFAEAGAKVVLSDLLVKEGTEASERLNAKNFETRFIKHDVTNENEWVEVISEISDLFGGLDILVNNAGIIIQKPLNETSLEEWRRAMAVNLDSVFLGTKIASQEIMKRSANSSISGSIINMSSVAGIVGIANNSSYNASKGAVRLLTKSNAMEFSDPSINIRVNSIHPGGINTNMIKNIINTSVKETGATEDEVRSQLEQIHPMQRLGIPEEVAKVALFLASTDSSYMTGSELVVDGGYTAS